MLLSKIPGLNRLFVLSPKKKQHKKTHEEQYRITEFYKKVMGQAIPEQFCAKEFTKKN